MRVWLDDDLEDSPAPEGWVQITTAAAAIVLVDSGEVVELSLDDDLGDDDWWGRGIDVVDFIAEQHEEHGRDLWPRDGISLHTADPSGRNAMARAIRRHAKRAGLRVRETREGGQIRFRFKRG